MAADNQQGAKITLHWLDKSRSHRILWLLEEMKLDYELKVYNRTNEKLAPPELKGVHPLGKSPVVGVQAANAEKPIILAESAAITEYLTEYFGKWLVPKRYEDGEEGKVGAETEEWLRYRFYMHYAEGSIMPLLVVSLIMHTIKNAPVPFFIKPITRTIASKVEESFLAPNFKTHFSFLEDQLRSSPNGGDYLCGKDITAADILMSFPLEGAELKGVLTKAAYPKTFAYLERLHQRDAHQRAGQKIKEVTGKEYDPNIF
ncbi:glutathione S-transferase [Phyllosticta capitalensis]|uniref:Glutathione S-transferase n=1 Tax=Phyllosticta capitalensis TaxID=121624 RepID=A0ABR1YNF9_9PEZI